MHRITRYEHFAMFKFKVFLTSSTTCGTTRVHILDSLVRGENFRALIQVNKRVLEMKKRHLTFQHLVVKIHVAVLKQGSCVSRCFPSYLFVSASGSACAHACMREFV